MKNNKKPFRMNGIWIAVIAFVFLASAAACSPAGAGEATPISSPDSDQPQPVARETSDEVKGVQSGQSTSQTPLPTVESEEAGGAALASPTAEIVDPTETPLVERVYAPSSRTALEASNPGSFQLASGGLQLVEFFAFW